ncbi:MAG: DMT family transporter [Pseudonocardia sp.]|nr:DMT family transporter [Pseudonocardia sp.]
MVYVLTLVAALIVAVGEVIQQRWAAQAPPEYNLSPKLLLWLVRRPRWLGGVGCSFGGNVVFAAALSTGSVILVEAVFVVRLIFVLIIAAVWNRHPVPLREMLGGLAITGGLVAFLLAAQPSESAAQNVPALRWAVGGGAAVAIAAVLAVVAARSGPNRKATLLGTGAGTLYGLQASLTQSAVLILSGAGALALLTTWNGYAVATVALLGMLLIQSAFEAAPIEASYPAVVTAQLVGAIVIGVTVLGGEVRLDPASLAVLLAALLLMILGVFLVARSPLVTGQATRYQKPEESTR